MAGPVPDNLFNDSNPYKGLHAIAKEERPDGLDEDCFAVAVLEHGKSISRGNLLWFKVKQKHSVAKLRAAYKIRTNINVLFLFAGHPVLDTTQMWQLDHLGDQLVVFAAHEEAAMTRPTAHIATSSQARSPLRLLSPQLHNVSATIKSESKVETQTSSAYPRTVTATPQAYISGLARQPTSIPIKRENGNEAPNLNEVAPGQGCPVQGADPSVVPKTEPLDAPHFVKPDNETDHIPISEVHSSTVYAEPARAAQQARLQRIIDEGSPERLEAEVKKNQSLLDNLKLQLVRASEQKDAQYFLQQIETLRSEKVDAPTVIGVVGNTGSGKSSIINAMLEEERLVPTNCMRACTAVVTELSWNSSDDENAKYRSEIEFIQASDWEKDLRVSLTELIDSSGQISKECYNAESEAGVAYAKIKAVYPNKTKEMLANSTVTQLMNVPEVKALLGTTKKVEKAQSEPFYRALQHYVDSKEKSTEQSNKKDKGEKKAMEFWPLIKVVRIYTKADALSTGAVIVDLPGVHDSNAARAAVAAGYMKQCTGLWIVAPITRAVDDKAAKSLLGESFKRQLKYDGIYSRVTFICSKTDDISITEASSSLNLEEQVSADWARIDEIDDQLRALKKTMQELKDTRSVYSELVNEADDEIEKWEKLKDDLEDGMEVWPPSANVKKRKRSLTSNKSPKKTKKSKSDGHSSAEEPNSEEESDSDASEAESGPEPEKGDPLTMEAVEDKLSQFKDDKRRARKERSALDAKTKSLNEEIRALQKDKNTIESAIIAICIKGRNDYSKGAIQTDFAAGVKELDQENAQEDDEANFDPEEDIRNYEEVARSLPVFCCSARAYQQMSGRLQRDSAVPGFRSIEETEIPQLQKHCKHLTEGVRASNCRRFLVKFSQIMNSLSFWATNDGTGLRISDAQRAIETCFLKSRLQALEKALDAAVRVCLLDMNEALAENIFENFGEVIQQAAAQALPTAQKWGSPVNKQNHEAGGFYWSTYKALCRRNGIFTNAMGSHDLNLQLCEPIIKHLASHWEKAFARRLPGVLQNFSRKSKNLLTEFHTEIEARSMKQGAGVAGLAMLGQQLRTYEAIFANLTSQMIEVINTLQRDANREFTPVIANKLASAYNWCAAEVGGGQFMRMKEHMVSHVDANLNMFAESCDEVKQRLTSMCDQVAKLMASKADEVFVNMSRDYTEVVSGSRVEGQMMPKWERLMKAEIAESIEENDREDTEADEIENQIDSEWLKGESLDQTVVLQHHEANGFYATSNGQEVSG